MDHLRSTIEIAAPAATVWQLLTDFERFPDWNPFITMIAGPVVAGKEIKVRMQSSDKLATTFRPRLLVVEPERELRWLGHLLVPGLFDGEHYFKIESVAPGRVGFEQGETFRGILRRPILALVGQSTQQGFVAMNAALKAEAEKRSG